MSVTVDLAELAAAAGPQVRIASSQHVREAGTGEAYVGFDGVASLLVTAAVSRLHKGRGAPSLTVIVEESADGDAWSEACSFEFLGDGEQTATITAPADQLRVRWEETGNGIWFIGSVIVAPSYLAADGGNGDLPDPTDEGDVLTVVSGDWAGAADGGSQLVLTRTTNLSSAQILTLNTTPIEVVPTPGTGKCIQVLAVSAKLTFGTTPYTIGSSGQPNYGYEGNEDNSFFALAWATLTASADHIDSDVGVWVTAFARDLAEDKALVFFVTEENPAGGDGTLQVTVWYMIDDLP